MLSMLTSLWLRNRTHSYPNPSDLTLSLGGKLKTWRFKSKVFPSWTLSTWVLLFSISLWEQGSVVNQRRKLWKKSDEGVVAYFPPIILYYPGIIHLTGHPGAHIMYSRYYTTPAITRPVSNSSQLHTPDIRNWIDYFWLNLLFGGILISEGIAI